jgi:hypothetical protein
VRLRTLSRGITNCRCVGRVWWGLVVRLRTAEIPRNSFRNLLFALVGLRCNHKTGTSAAEAAFALSDLYRG